MWSLAGIAIVRGTLGTILAEATRVHMERTALILVGRALAVDDFRESAVYDASYRRRFRTGERS